MPIYRSAGSVNAAEAVARLEDAGLGAFMRPSQLEEAGFTRHQLRRLVALGVLERHGRGLYRRAGVEATENFSLALVCSRVPQGIVCLLSALRAHGIGSQAPAAVWLAIPNNARRPRLAGLRLRVVRFSGPAQRFGVQRTAFEGVPARITSPARTVADCFRYERLVGAEAAREALDDALRQRRVTRAELARVDEVLPSRRLRAALDARA